MIKFNTIVLQLNFIKCLLKILLYIYFVFVF